MRLVEARNRIYPEAERFVAELKTTLERQRIEWEHAGQRSVAIAVHRLGLKTIDAFRSDGRYAGDGTRIDLAYSIYALSHGASDAEIAGAIRSRDLSHKGSEKRQNEYVERTIKKALAAIDRGR